MIALTSGIPMLVSRFFMTRPAQCIFRLAADAGRSGGGRGRRGRLYPIDTARVIYVRYAADIDRIIYVPLLQKRLDAGLHFRHVRGRLKSGSDISVFVDNELCEVPLDVRLFVPVRVCL